jgi:hypothetical protein
VTSVNSILCVVSEKKISLEFYLIRDHDGHWLNGTKSNTHLVRTIKGTLPFGSVVSRRLKCEKFTDRCKAMTILTWPFGSGELKTSMTSVGNIKKVSQNYKHMHAPCLSYTHWTCTYKSILSLKRINPFKQLQNQK